MHPWWDALNITFVHPHRFFEVLAYPVAGIIFRRQRKLSGVASRGEDSLALAAGAIMGAAILAQLLAWAQHMPTLLAAADVAAADGGARPISGGRSIAGGIVGGWLGVEWIKRLRGIRESTGDAFVPAIVFGTIVGRMGCFFSGVEDGTHGLPSTVPWAMDLGDGALRHPTALYEMFFVAVLYLCIRLTRRGGAQAGDAFRVYVFGYMLWRFFVDGLKPAPWTLGGLSAIQWFCVLVAVGMIPTMSAIGRRWRRPADSGEMLPAQEQP
jgi:prolipoprotein diacylglyceryltransferase